MVFRSLPALFCAAAWFAAVGQATGTAAQTPKMFEVRGVKLQYVVAGKGEPVVLIHGLHASGALNWQVPGIYSELVKNYQVIALDLPGHGGSEKPADERAYGLQVVADVVALLDHLQIEKAHIVGYSAGGMIVMKLLAMHPQRVRSAIVAGMGWLRAGSPLQRFWEEMPSRARSRTPPAFVHGLAKLALSEAELKKIGVPVEIVVGADDPVKRMYVDPLRAARPDWPVVEIPAAGHVNCLAKPEFLAEIVRWLEAHK